MRLTVSAGRLIWLVAVVAAATGTTSSFAADAKLDQTLAHQAFVALPAVYEVTGKVFVESLTTTDGRRVAIDQAIPFRGTSFGVAPGRVVTARHLISPPDERIFEDLDQLPASRSKLPATASEVGEFTLRRVETVTLIRASDEATATTCGGSAGPTKITADVGTATTDPDDDLVLLEIPDTAAPTLRLVDEQTKDTPIAIIGFGGQLSAIPSIRPGKLLGPAKNNGLARLEADVVRGDSGGPVIDDEGRSHGVVLRREVGERKPAIGGAASVNRLLDKDGTKNAESATTSDFRAGMEAFWDRDYTAAEARLSDLATRVPNADVIRCQLQQAAQLKNASYTISGPSRTRTAILALGAMATLAAAIFGILRVARHPLD
jgi:Trypsin-like peptidase domain